MDFSSRNESFRGDSWSRRSELGATDSRLLEERARALLAKCVQASRRAAKAPLSELSDTLVQLAAPVDFEDEAGQALVEAAALCIKPSDLLALFAYLGARAQRRIIVQWQRLKEALPLERTMNEELLQTAARAYVWVCASDLADILETSFVEDGNSARSQGDLYIAVNERYYFNYDYLFRDIGLARRDVIRLLKQLADAFPPEAGTIEALGGEQVFRAVVKANVALQGEDAPKALTQLMPLVGIAAEELGQQLPKQLVRRLVLSATARQLGFELQAQDLLEVYECLAVLAALEPLAAPTLSAQRPLWLNFLLFLYARGSTAEGDSTPNAEWQLRWQEVENELGRDALVAACYALIPIYQHYARMLSSPNSARNTAVWIAASLADPKLSAWVVALSTEHGAASPIVAASLLHEAFTPQAFGVLCDGWAERVAMVPVHPTWSRDFTVLVLRFAIARQKSWLLDRLVDLYIRGGAFEEGATRENVSQRLASFLQSIALGPDDLAELNSSLLRFDLLPLEVNVFTGERIDDSRWASPTAAFKYVRTLLRIATRGPDQLAGLLSERRVVGLEKSLRQLDFHSSAQQIVACRQAFQDDPKAGLEFFLLLRSSDGERARPEWLARCTRLLAPLAVEQCFELLWELYRCDHGDGFSLNPGLFWAMRLCPNTESVLLLGKAATDMVRRQPSFAVAALDTLDAISSRPALSAILQMRRRIRNRKVLKLINRTIDHIAKQQGVASEVFLDYSVDTGDLENDATRVFDFGTHQVTLSIELDGQLSTLVLDAKGKRLRSFPKTAKDADPALYREFQGTKKQLAETLAYQARRLESAMIEGRHWFFEDFRDIFLEHPVMASLARRLVWVVARPNFPEHRLLLSQTPPGEPELVTFRPDAERLVDAMGNDFELPTDARLHLVHPLYLSPECRAQWLAQLARIKVMQPFDQMARHVFHEHGELQRLEGRITLGTQLYRIVKERGWSTDGGTTWEPGFETHSCRNYPDQQLTVHLNTGVLGEDDRVQLTEVYFCRAEARLELEDVDPMVYSEALRDIVICLAHEPR